MAKEEEKEFYCKGSLLLDDVTFFIRARDIEHAKQKAADGQFFDHDPNNAESVQWKLKPNTIKPN